LEASYPYNLIVDDLGNQVLYFKFDNLPPYVTKVISITANLRLSDTANATPMDDPHSFLQSEKYLESNDSELSQFAKKFKGSSQLKTAEAIFRWVSENIEYTGYESDIRGALYALKNKRGDCTEFMYLFTALCRANSIPARGIGGYVLDDDTLLKPNMYHNWAEFYIEGVWSIADPQKKVFMQADSHYIAMQVIGESAKNPMGQYHRYRFSGEGLRVKMNK
jgi:transglutaminase-like putative cysteine protease